MTVTEVVVFSATADIDDEHITGDRRQKCTRGHEWNFGFNFVGIRLDMPQLGNTNGAEDYCFFCLRDMLRQHCGRVKDV